jgi:hypothetical protein
MTTKWTQFPEGGNVRVGDKTVGLRDGENTQFNMPGTGIQDADGNFLVAWSAADNAVNYMQYTNADTGDYPILETKGQDATVGLNIDTKGNGSVRLNMGTGDLVINDSVGINEISDDDTFADASDETLQTSLATKTYIDTHGGDSVTLTSAGVAVGTTSLVNDGTGPALAIKGVVGSTNIAVTTNTTDTTVAITGTIPIANGGTNNTTIGASGALAQSDGTKINYTTATYPSTATSAGKFLRADGTNWAASTATLANTYNQYDMLYASAANTVTGLAKASNSVLTSNLASVPAWTELGNFQFLGGSLDGPKPFLITVANGLSVSYNSGTTPGTVTVELEVPVSIANGGTNTTSAIGASGTLAQSDGTKYTFTTATYPSTAGTSGTILRSNGTNIVNSTPTFPNTAASGKLMRGDGTNWTETTAQYPDTAGTAGNILISDGTNFVSSAPAISFGRMTVSNAYTGATFTISTTLKEVSTTQGLSVAWVLDTDSSTDFSLPADGQLTYIGTNPKTFMVDYSLTLNSGTRIQVALYKNGGLVKTSYGNGTSETGIRGCEITLENGDDLALWLAQASSGGGVAIYFGQLSLWSVD